MGFADTTIYGNIATNVEVKQTSDGKDRANFLIIANTRKEKKVPLNVTAWGYGAQTAAAAGKGAAVLASGSLEAWSKTDGDPIRYSLNASRVIVPRQPGENKLKVKDVDYEKVNSKEDDLPF
jgi:single-stranded DNA-binding protein